MFLGHFAVGLAASRAEPRLKLGTAFLAAQLPDAVWPYFVLAGVERVAIAPGDTAVTPLRFDSYPWSHSLVAVVAWGALLGLVGFLRTKQLKPAGFLAALAVSHWLLDAASHRPDMPILPVGGPVVGLGLWYSLPWTLAVESGLFLTAVAIYAKGRQLSRGFWALLATLSFLYLGNLFGPPPPSVAVVAGSLVVGVPLFWFWGNRVSARSS